MKIECDNKCSKPMATLVVVSFTMLVYLGFLSTPSLINEAWKQNLTENKIID